MDFSGDLPKRRLMQAGRELAEGNREIVRAHIADHERRMHFGRGAGPDSEVEVPTEGKITDDVLWSIVLQSEREGVPPIVVAEERGLDCTRFQIDLADFEGRFKREVERLRRGIP